MRAEEQLDSTTDYRLQTCHGVRDDCDQESLVPHLDANVRVLHGYNHLLHLTHTQSEISLQRPAGALQLMFQTDSSSLFSSHALLKVSPCENMTSALFSGCWWSSCRLSAPHDSGTLRSQHRTTKWTILKWCRERAVVGGAFPRARRWRAVAHIQVLTETLDTRGVTSAVVFSPSAAETSEQLKYCFLLSV